jgi:thioredoxin reductase
MNDVDVVIVGAGPAGTSAALVLGRCNRRTVLLGDGPTRNAAARHGHNLFSRDHAPPATVAAEARQQLDRYPDITITESRATTLRRPADDRFEVTTADGDALTAEAVILATGTADGLPPVTGLADLWGVRAHTCPYCDAWEYTGRRLLVVGRGAAVLGEKLSRWTDDLVLNDSDAAAGPVVTAVAADADHVRVDWDSGADTAVDGIFVVTDKHPRTDLARQVGADIRDTGHVVVDALQSTSIDGLYAAGDCAVRYDESHPIEQVAVAAGDGVRAGIAVDAGLANPD